jgi:hypothetical protein
MPKAKRQDLGKMFSAVPPQDKALKTVKEKRPDRVGRKATLFQVPESAKKQLAILGIEVDKTQQALLSEALNDLFKKYGKQPIA